MGDGRTWDLCFPLSHLCCIVTIPLMTCSHPVLSFWVSLREVKGPIWTKGKQSHLDEGWKPPWGSFLGQGPLVTSLLHSGQGFLLKRREGKGEVQGPQRSTQLCLQLPRVPSKLLKAVLPHSVAYFSFLESGAPRAVIPPSSEPK